MSIYEGIIAGLEDALAYKRGEENDCVIHEVDDDQMRNRRHKISKSKPPKKASHKHVYEPCVFEFYGPRFSKEQGVVYDEPSSCISAYCPICGKVGSLPDVERWYPTITAQLFDGRRAFLEARSPECERELAPETRTLPTFWVEDRWFTKYVDIGDSNGSNC